MTCKVTLNYFNQFLYFVAGIGRKLLMIPDITNDNHTQNCNNPEPKIYMKKLYS